MLVSRFSLLTVMAAVLTGCQASPEAPLDAPSEVATGASEGAQEGFVPELVPGGSALENKPFVDFLLQAEIAAATERVTAEKLLTVLQSNGFESSALEFTRDTSLIELPADSISIAIRINDECLITQWGSDWYASSVESLLVTDTCLLGSARTLD